MGGFERAELIASYFTDKLCRISTSNSIISSKSEILTFSPFFINTGRVVYSTYLSTDSMSPFSRCNNAGE